MPYRIVAILIMICVSCTAGVCATEDSLAAIYDNLPVFFVTDREVKVEKNKNKYSYGKQNIEPNENLVFGIENKKTKIPVELQSGLNWRQSFQLEIFGDRYSPKGMKWRTFSGVTYGYLYNWSRREKFYGELNTCLSSCPTKEVVIFIHGCCVDHAEASRQAANIQKWYRRPVILYDWGTESKVYLQSLKAYPQTQSKFNQFVVDFKAKFPDTKITVVAYSVGSNILKDYCLQAKESDKPDFDNVFILRADTNVESLEKALPMVVAQSKTPVQLWVSSNDAQMKASRLLRKVVVLPVALLSQKGLRGGETRAWMKKQIDGVQVVDVTELALGHDIPYQLLSLSGKAKLQEGDLGTYSISLHDDRVFYARKK